MLAARILSRYPSKTNFRGLLSIDCYQKLIVNMPVLREGKMCVTEVEK